MANRRLLAQSKKASVMVSYLTIFFNSVCNLILTPLYLHYLGVENYGLYQMVYSVAHYILILDFGINLTMIKYISMYKVKGQQREESNFAAHSLLVVALIIAAILLIGFILNGLLTRIYPSITSAEAPIAHTLFLLMVVNVAFAVLEHYFQGVVLANEHFVVQKLTALVKVVMKIVLTLILLRIGLGMIALALVDLALTLCALLLLSIYSFRILSFRIRFTGFDRALTTGMLAFMFAVFLQSIVAYVNNLVDKTILGIMTTKTDVVVYSVAMTFITLLSSLSHAISGIFLPQATKVIHAGAGRKELTAFVVRPGRLQFMICGSILAGFSLFGREFITLWVGKDQIGAWAVALIIMASSLIPQVEETAQSILDVKNKRMVRSLIMLALSAVNVAVTVVLVGKFGMIGAPVGTAIAFIVGYLILNIYYDRRIGIDVPAMLRGIFSGTWLSVLCASLLSGLLNFVFPRYAWLTLILKILCYCLCFLVFQLLWGFRARERDDLRVMLGPIRRLLRRGSDTDNDA